MPIQTCNPATGEVLKSFPPISDKHLEEKIEKARTRFIAHHKTSFTERSALMRKAGEILEAGKEAFARMMTLEMGKLYTSALAEASKCAWVCRFYADEAEKFLADELVQTSATKSYVRYEPLGPVLAIMPWNFPFWQVFRFAAPAIMAGNVGLLKHASNVPQCALAIEDIFRRAGFPEGVFQTLLLPSAGTARVIEDFRIKAVTLTGSDMAGREVGGVAGSSIKTCVMELGGSDPFIVMPGADMDMAVPTAVKARTVNNGQSCIAAKRFILHRDIASTFTERFVAEMKELKTGDPMDPATDVGPLATPEILEDLDRQVRKSVRKGAQLLLGGERLPGKGNFYPPTVLTDIPKDSPAYREEFFGPVALLFTVDSAEDAVQLANDSPFGLGSSAWTNDGREKALFIENLEAGSVFVNEMVSSDVRLPFGGVKNSGYGRELSVHGIREFVNVKTVYVK
ncbi:MAG TPA: NAD-dependent succinate-semialdehyde dehydrogenase [Bacteroidota bacterium]|nr:NAD-dependent succinate-semialdehyde dehydrogenase [Bacteroidota bacterium]